MFSASRFFALFLASLSHPACSCFTGVFPFCCESRLRTCPLVCCPQALHVAWTTAGSQVSAPSSLSPSFPFLSLVALCYLLPLRVRLVELMCLSPFSGLAVSLSCLVPSLVHTLGPSGRSTDRVNFVFFPLRAGFASFTISPSLCSQRTLWLTRPAFFLSLNVVLSVCGSLRLSLVLLFGMKEGGRGRSKDRDANIGTS